MRYGRNLSIGALAAGISALAIGQASAAASNIVYILDASNSMWGQIDGTAKIDTARDALGTLLGDVPDGTDVGLLVYGHRSEGSCTDIELVAPLGSQSAEQLTASLSSVTPKGKTPIAGALSEAGKAFPTNDAANNVVLISDGIETCEGDPCTVAGELASAGVQTRIHAIGFDVDDAAREQLQCIAEAGNGSYYDAANAEEFRVAVAEVQTEVAKAPEPEPEPAPEPELYFEDDFAEADLAEVWEVKNPNPDAFIVEDDQLLMVSSAKSGFNVAETPNLIILGEELPKGDWTMTATVTAEYATSREDFWMGLVEDEQNYVAARLFSAGDKYYGWTLNLRIEKASNGEVAYFDTKLKGLSCNVCNENRMFPNFAETIAEPIKVSLIREGRKMYARAEIEGDVDEDGNQVVYTTDAVSTLRLPGDPAITVGQYEKVNGETLFFIDRIEITKDE